jgi:hypothetical protein
MTRRRPLDTILASGPVQLAYAVDDVVAAAHEWVARGAGPFFVREHIPVADARIRGEAGSFDHSSAYGQWGPVMIELICQHDGGADPVVGSGGLHHVAHFVDDVATASASLVAAGHPEVLFARAGGAVPFAFHDGGAVFGHLIEIYERTEHLAAFYAMVADASVGWDGADPIR